MVLAAGPELIEDIRRAPDDVLSIYEPTVEVGIVCDTYESHLTRISSFNLNILLTCWILPPPFTNHHPVLRSKLTQNIAITFKEVREEVVKTLDDWIPKCNDRTCQT